MAIIRGISLRTNFGIVSDSSLKWSMGRTIKLMISFIRIGSLILTGIIVEIHRGSKHIKLATSMKWVKSFRLKFYFKKFYLISSSSWLGSTSRSWIVIQ